RQRSRPAYEAMMLDDLERLGLVPDVPPIAAFRAGATPYRQSDASEGGEAPGLRVPGGAGTERWIDLLAGPMADEPAAAGDVVVRDRVGNWTYAFCVVVDDQRHRVDLVIRGRDLLDATPVQLRLAGLLGRDTPPAFLHHPLVRRVSGQKLSKSARDTA